MKNLEKEERYLIDSNIVLRIIEISDQISPKEKMIDLTCGKLGFNSLEKYGYICRVRNKNGSICMEVKQRQDDGSFVESKIKLNTIKDGVDFFGLLGMTPYLCIEREREVREYKGLKIFIDNVELLGTFVEIEYQNIIGKDSIIDEFKSKTGINGEPQGLYGDLFNEKMEKDQEFKEKMLAKINSGLAGNK